MVNPVPSHPAITTPYGRRGSHWSCQRNAAGQGVHTGADWGSPGINGAPVVAARPGQARHVNFGAAFGDRQLAIWADDGTVDFYAHMASRLPANGEWVQAGQRVGTVGARGNATGPHLHFERHRNRGGWSCSNHMDPAASISWGGTTTPTTPGQPPAAPARSQEETMSTVLARTPNGTILLVGPRGRHVMPSQAEADAFVRAGWTVRPLGANEVDAIETLLSRVT